MGICIVDPNSQTPLHTHQNEEEAMFIFGGRGKAKIQDNEYALREGSIIFCPPGISHQIINDTKRKLQFLFAYSPGGPEQTVKTAGKPTNPIGF